MEERRATWFSPRGIVIAAAPGGGASTELPLFCGSLHYWRLEPAAWPVALAAMKRIGLEVVTSYVPWSVHEREPGRFDWSGARDLGRFLDEVAAAGMHAILRPGPHINAELTLFGFPERVLERPEHQARTARGTPAWMPAPPRMFPVPSYASSGFIAETKGWLVEVGRALDGRLAPEGPVIAVQLDNEHGMFFRVGAYDLDYHPEALAWWAEDSGGLEPPRRWLPDDPGRCARWVAHKETYAARALAWIGDGLDGAGLGGLARFHNAPPISPVELAAVGAGERARSMPAWDIYQSLRQPETLRDAALYLAGNTTLPFVAELGVGGPAYLPAPDPADQQSAAIALLGLGVRAFNFYMAVDRDRWTGGALDRHGEPLAAAAWIARLTAALRDIDLPSLSPWPGGCPPVGVILSRADHRHAIASSHIDPVTPLVAELLDLGPGGFAELGRDPGARRAARWRRAIAEALDCLEVPWVLLDEATPVEVLEDYRLLVCPTIDRIDAGLWSRLRQVAAGGVRVIIGPRRPGRDAFDEPLEKPGLVANMGVLRPETLENIDQLGEDLAGAAGELEDQWIAPASPELRVTPLRDPHGAVKALILANRGPATRAAIAVTDGLRLRDPLSDETFEARGERLEVDIGPARARLLIAI